MTDDTPAGSLPSLPTTLPPGVTLGAGNLLKFSDAEIQKTYEDLLRGVQPDHDGLELRFQPLEHGLGASILGHQRIGDAWEFTELGEIKYERSKPIDWKVALGVRWSGKL